MRALLIVGTLVTATLIPWDSLTAPGASPLSGGSATQAGGACRTRPLTARLSPTLGIVPLAEGIEDAQPVQTESLVKLPPTSGDEDRELRVAENRPEGHASGARSVPPGVVCKDGVCSIPDRGLRQSPPAVRRASDPDSDDIADTALITATPSDAAPGDLTWEQARERLQQLGATHFRLEMDSESGQYRFWCRLPVKGQTNVGRQFEAWAPSDMAAVIQILAQVEAWRSARR